MTQEALKNVSICNKNKRVIFSNSPYIARKGSNNLKNEIGSKLKELRKAKRLNQDDVAIGTGICRSSLSNYETGRRTPALNQLVILANFYGVALDYFGIVQEDDVFDLLIRAKKLFENENISAEDKQHLFDELMKFYISIKK
jgi:transcriptional regulator with XRE-family HTH domain